MIADIPCPIMFEMISETRKSVELQNLAKSRGLTVRVVRDEFGDVTVTQVVASAEPDPQNSMGWPKYIADLDALRAQGGDFAGSGEPIISNGCKPERDLEALSSRVGLSFAGFVLVFDMNDGQHAVADAARLSLHLDSFVGKDQMVVRISHEAKGSFVYRVKRGDYGKPISASLLIAGDSVFRRQSPSPPALLK